MKFLLLILSLVAITAGSTFFVAPQLREFHEGWLKRDIVEALTEDKADYIDVEVKMNHLHAEKIQIDRIGKEGETVDSIKDNVVEIVTGVYGATVDRGDITVNLELAPVKPIEAPVVKPSLPEVDPRSEPMPDIAVNPEPKVKPEPEVKPVLVSSEVYVEWNERKNEFRVDGKMPNSSEKDAFVSMLEKQYKSAVVNDNIVVDKDHVAEAGKVLELQNYLAKIIQANYGKGSVGIKDSPASLTLNGTLKSKEDFKSLNSQLQPLMKSATGEPTKVVNHFKYHPEFVILKDDKKRKVILSGYANRNNSVNLSSYIKRYTQDAENQYEFVSDIIPDERSVEYVWTEADQKLLDAHLRSAVHGEIYYENDMVSKVTGVTADADYHKMLQDRFADKATEIQLTYDANAKPQTAMVDVAAKVEEAKKEQEVAANKLRTELKEYKIYFKSGAKAVESKYDPQLEDMATIISKSEDKTSVIVIGGFADHTGNPASNEKLSKERAASVQAKLVELGVPITRTVVEFFGAEGADVDKKLSRRVEIRVR